MAFYDKFPYTNYQELNLDWLLQEVSKVRDNRDATDASAAAALASEQAAKASETAAAASQQAAANSETAAAGSEAASADYLAQIGTHTAGAVADWLKKNLTPTTPPIDATLTVSGAAADAKVTGDRLSYVNNVIENNGYLIEQDELIQGSYNRNGSVVSDPKRIRTAQFIPVTNGGSVHFVPGENVSGIFYGKFDADKSYLGDGPGWIIHDFVTDWDGYMICVYKNAGDTDITPAEYDALTLVMTAGEKEKYELRMVGPFISSQNPMNPLMFDRMYFRKGSITSGTEYVTNYPEPGFINNHFDDLNVAPSSGLNTGYMSFRFSEPNSPKVLASGETLTMFILAKSNKAMHFKCRLSTGTVWGPVFSVAVADPIDIPEGTSCLKMNFHFDHTGTSGGDNYRYFVLEGNTNYSDLEAEIVIVSGGTFLEWIKRIEDIAHKSFNTDLLFWGDSLTAGAGGGNTSYPKVCAETLGLTRINAGVGGETANTIAARQGGNNVIIPAGNVNGTYPTLSDIFGASIEPLLQGTGADSGNALIIDGQTCTLSHDANGYTISGYTGSAITVPKLARFRGSSYTGKVVVIFVGQNGATFTGLTGVDARIAIIDSMIKHIGHEHYVVLGLSTGTDTSRTDDDNQMRARYGNKFFPTRKLLVDYGLTINGLTPTAQDETDIANGTVPTQLRSDGIHLNAYGYTAIGKLLADKIRSLGYVD